MRSEIKAYAKVNLFLDITGRLENGYHTLNTVMQQIDLYDDITVDISEGNGIFIECDNPAVPCNEKNIVHKAAEAFLSETGHKARVEIRIKKRIPLEAGMGGSSTDGAAVLKALNEIYGYPLSTERLCSIGAKLGADVPFCITGGTAVCKGIGEIMTPADCLKDYVFLIVKPDFSCSTPAGYKAYDENPVPEKENFNGFVESLSMGAEKWADKMYNVFEKLYDDDRIAAITQTMRNNGALGSVLTGSGSAVFGVFKDNETASEALKNIDSSFKFIARPE
ncbi:MAG: 4-(cytidine 5'-diphospho)-2-C-methyl-D-erythritol kinase [Oscillospiraceae bacterium]|nr:4-(cytidine 5'-diphospho)-2-C-methyl-D-erythritol kinase [Oscillospiraceae bacterium]